MCKDEGMGRICQVGSWCLLLALAAAGAQARTLERGLGPEPETLDPHRAADLPSFQVLRDLYEGLVGEDPSGRIVPGAARAWTVSADGLEWRFTLREEGRDCAGRRVDAQRFAASLARARDPATAAPLAGLLAPVVAVEPLAPDALRIRLSEPVDLLRRLVLPIAYPVDLEALAEQGEAAFLSARAASNGPYCLRSYRAQDGLLLEKNPFFHGAAAVAIGRVRYHASEDPLGESRRFLNGELHLTESAPPWPLAALRRRFGESLRASPLAGVFEIGLFLEGPPFQGNPALREALSAAIDRERLIERITVGGERPAYGFVPPELGGAARPEWADWPRARREAYAQALYRAAGYGPKHPLRFELLYNASPQHRRVLLAVAAMWREVLGAEVALVHQEWRTFLSRRARGEGLQAFRLGWVADVGEPEEFLARFRSGSPLNHTRFRDPEFDALLERARRTHGRAREEALAAAERRLLALTPAIPLFFLAGRRLVSPALGGYADHPLDRHPSRWLYFRE